MMKHSQPIIQMKTIISLFILTLILSCGSSEKESQSLTDLKTKKATLILETTLNNATLQLFDINGRMLLSQELINKVAILNMEKLPAASYVVRVHNNMESQQKIIMKK